MSLLSCRLLDKLRRNQAATAVERPRPMLHSMDALLSIVVPVGAIFGLGLVSVAVATCSGVWLALRQDRQREQRGRRPLYWGR